MKKASPKPALVPANLEKPVTLKPITITKEFVLALQGQELTLTPEEAETLYEVLKDALSL